MSHDDPRLTDEYVRRRPATPDRGEVTVIGVVHDHPSSKYRVQQLVRTTDPDVLALELPSFAVPLFREYAEDERSPPQFGGEMSTAVQAADTDRIIGIDGPSVGFVGHLLRQATRERHSLSTIRSVVDSLTAVSKHAVVCRLGALVSRTTGLTVEVDRPVQHECEWSDEPDLQARDEQTQAQQARTVLNAFPSSGAGQLRRTVRERYMADRLDTLRHEGESVTAVVGIAHLEPVVEQLDGD